MTADERHDPKWGNDGGSRVSHSTSAKVRQPDRHGEAEPKKDETGVLAQENRSDAIDRNDPHKTEKLAKAGRDIDPNEGAD